MDSTNSWARPVFRAWALTLRFQKFLVVGATGLLVNQLTLFFLAGVLHFALPLASPLAIVTSMVVTFVLNELWTWSDRGHGSWYQRAVMYGMINSGGLLINAGILLFLEGQGLHYLIANLVGAAAAAIWNFSLNNALTWRK